MDGWQFIVDNHKAIERLARRSCRGCYGMIDELVEVVYDHAPKLVENYNPERGVELRAYVFNSLRWWMFKYMNKEAARLEGVEEFHCDDHYTEDDLQQERREEVYKLMEGVDEFEQLVIELHHGGYTWREISQISSVEHTKLFRIYHQAMQKIREAARDGK
jgi:RNA polymerase sigma factor (sigma-70 family)